MEKGGRGRLRIVGVREGGTGRKVEGMKKGMEESKIYQEERWRMVRVREGDGRVWGVGRWWKVKWRNVGRMEEGR